MKKAKTELNDWLRPEYKRSDFGKLVRGKYAKRIRESTNVILLDPQVAKVFPNDEAVNNALRGLIVVTRSAKSGSKRKSNATEKTRSPSQKSDSGSTRFRTLGHPKRRSAAG